MGTFNDLWTQLKIDLVEYAEDGWMELKDAAISDGDAFLEKSKSDIERWSKLLAKGELTPDDFEWLLAGKKDLAELESLKQVGLSRLALDRFLSGIIETVVSTTSKII